MDFETSIETRPMTVEEYIAFEEKSELRHEMINQQLFPMPGTTFDHNEICSNLTLLLKNLLRQLGYRVYQEGVKAQIIHARDYLYPDVIVTKEPRSPENQYIVKEPSVIFEVISKNSRIADTVDKFIRYKKIESLQNYILVDSEKVLVEVRYKLPDGTWEAEIFVAADKKFPAPVLGLELTFDDVYEGVSFF